MRDPRPHTDENSDSRLRELVQEARRLRDFAELSSDWFWEQDAEFRFTRFFGVSPEKLQRQQSDFIGKRRWDMPIGGVSPAQLAEHIATCERHERFQDFVYEIPSTAGAPQYYAISGTPVFDADGNFTGYHGVGRNITELRRAEQAITESERRLAQIVDGNPVPIFVIDGSHRVTQWNQACERLTGIPAGLMVGKREAWRGFYASPRPTMADLVVEDAPELNVALHYEGKYNRSRLIHGGFEAEDFFPQMVGGGRWLFFTAAPLRDSHGRIVGAIETLQDVTARMAAERAEREHWTQLQAAHTELQQAMQQLVEAEKLAALGRLVAGISHELNTPLGNAQVVATSLTDLLDELATLAATGKFRRSELERLLSAGRDAGGILVGSIARAAKLMSRFREIVAEPGHDRPQTFRLREVVDHVVRSAAARLSEHNVAVEVAVPVDIGMQSYPDAVAQVLSELIDNSLIHAFADRANGSIRISATAIDGKVSIDYADNGCGMGAEVRRHAFDPFYTTRLGQGESGLGLYLAHNLATAALGGRIELAAASQDGVLFRLSLAQRR